ncbi:YSC84-related protein [Thiomicrorhabdus cannonii]|uniref:lipid-binding SYLF domain-containing protein n=1 Tax=Thiomicrorhabdus cannonii TaxID=2748011 RepID=UPI0015C0FB5E|nr:lipid-binding SYLF domain-containing protein [Thiomicrorhabdus cannonii]
MKALTRALFLMLAWLWILPAQADQYNDTVQRFHKADQTRDFFDNAYGFALFPTVGKGGFMLGAAYGEGRVYRGLKHVGNTTLNQVSFGWQLGGQAYSQIIFFEDKRAFDEFTSGSFEFGAQASAVVITAGAAAEVSTKGTSATAGVTQDHTANKGSYYKGMATFVIVKGGLMYEAAIGGQHFTYTPKGESEAQ